MQLEVHHYVHFDQPVQDPRFQKILELLGVIATQNTAILAGEKQIMATEKEVLDALDKIDAATTKAAGNIQILADTDQKISDEFDVLVAELKAAGVSDALVTRAQGLADASQKVSDSLDTMVPALQAIASKGVVEPVPVPVPDPTPVPVQP